MTRARTALTIAATATVLVVAGCSSSTDPASTSPSASGSGSSSASPSGSGSPSGSASDSASPSESASGSASGSAEATVKGAGTWAANDKDQRVQVLLTTTPGADAPNLAALETCRQAMNAPPVLWAQVKITNLDNAPLKPSALFLVLDDKSIREPLNVIPRAQAWYAKAPDSPEKEACLEAARGVAGQQIISTVPPGGNITAVRVLSPAPKGVTAVRLTTPAGKALALKRSS